MNKRYFKIQIYAYGSEVVLGTIPENQYIYWSKKLADNEDTLSNYFSEYEFDDEKANENHPDNSVFNCSWFELDDITHVHGPEVTDQNIIEITETDQHGKQIDSIKYDMSKKTLASHFNISEERFDLLHDKIKDKKFFMGQTFEKGTWNSSETDVGLIETNEEGIDIKKLTLHITEIAIDDEECSICYAFTYNGDKYLLNSDTQTNSSYMNVYESSNAD